MANDFRFKDYRWNPYSTLGLSLNIPIFSGGYTNALTTQAVANRERVRSELEATVNKTHIEVTKQYSGVISGLAKEIGRAHV